MPEWAELQRTLTKEAFSLPATRGLKKDSHRTITPAAEAGRVPAHLATPEYLQAKQLCYLHAQLSLGQSCHRQKNSYIYVHRVILVLSDSLQPCRLWPARLLCQRGEFSRQEYWSVLTKTGCHTLLEHYIPTALAANPLEYLMLLLVLPEPLRPKQLHHLHTWPSQGQIQVLQSSLRSKPQWTTHMERWK